MITDTCGGAVSAISTRAGSGEEAGLVNVVKTAEAVPDVVSGEYSSSKGLCYTIWLPSDPRWLKYFLN
jgi:hypothetical protein